MSCEFCKYLTDMQTFDRIREQGNPRLHHDYHVAIIQRAWNDYTGLEHSGTMAHKPRAVGFEIRYCPECGKRIEDGK